MKYTGNYNLKKPEGTDLVKIEDFNDNADILDAELGKKVDKTQIVNTLSETVAGKALDARQGKVLDDKIATVVEQSNDIAVGLNEKGFWDSVGYDNEIVNANDLPHGEHIGFSLINAPTSSEYFYKTMRHPTLPSKYAYQEAYASNGTMMYSRALVNGVWEAWQQFATDKTFSYTLTPVNGFTVLYESVLAVNNKLAELIMVLNVPSTKPNSGTVVANLPVAAKYRANCIAFDNSSVSPQFVINSNKLVIENNINLKTSGYVMITVSFMIE